jgi:hypothetical protein
MRREWLSKSHWYQTLCSELRREPVYRCLERDLPAITTQVRVPDVIHHDNKHIGLAFIRVLLAFLPKRVQAIWQSLAK